MSKCKGRVGATLRSTAVNFKGFPLCLMLVRAQLLQLACFTGIQHNLSCFHLDFHLHLVCWIGKDYIMGKGETEKMLLPWN